MNDPLLHAVLLIGGMTLVTFGARYPVLAIVSRVKLPERVFKALRYVPTAVLTAIVVPAVLMPDGKLTITPGSEHLVGTIAAGLIAWRTRSLLLTIGIGMAVFLVWRLLF